MPDHLPMVLAATLLAALTALPAHADPISGTAARAQLYRADRVEVVRYDAQGLSADEIQILATVAQTQKYYAAVAFAPTDGLMSEATVMAANHHSVDAARRAALAECQARASGACVIALEVRPAGWEARDLQLSADATEALGQQYAAARGARAFAISAATGLWGMGRGDDARAGAVSACQGNTGTDDCTVVIAD